MPDRGLTHVALLVGDVDASLAFYARYAAMQVVHQRADAATGARVAWLTDHTRPFVIVLVEAPSREEVDRLCDAARREGCLRRGPTDSGYPVGYWAFIADPDGHMLEISFGQEVGLTVEAH